MAGNSMSITAVVTGWDKTIAALEATQKVLDRANMYGVRAGGRKVKAAGKRNAPVDTGALRKSIASSRKLTGNGAMGYSVFVAPHVDYAYSNAANGYGDTTYMERALADGAAGMAAAFEAAYARVLARAGL